MLSQQPLCDRLIHRKIIGTFRLKSRVRAVEDRTMFRPNLFNGRGMSARRTQRTGNLNVFNWTSAVDLGCWGFVMRQTCGYREQHADCLPARPELKSITNQGPQIGDLLASTGHGVIVT